MATVKLSDVIIPEVYLDYQSENTPEKTAFVESGIAVTNPILTARANSGGNIIDVPEWKDLDSSIEPNLSDDSDNEASPNKIATDSQIARNAYLNQGWSTRDLTGELAGSNPMQRIREHVDIYWTRQWQRRILASCNGILADNIANNAGDMVNSIAIEDGDNAAAANLISRSAVVRTAFTLGDAFESTGIIAMHSVVYERLVELDDIDFVKDSTGTLTIPTYLGKRIIIDDGMTAVAGTTSGVKYTTILFGAGAIGYGMGSPATPVEVEREARVGAGAGEETLWTRKTWLVHPSGFKFNSATIEAGKPSASLANLRLPANWTRVHARKNVPVAFLVSNG